MKKLITLIFAILLSALLMIPAVAADDAPVEDLVTVTFSEDYTTLTLDGVSYSRVNVTMLDYEHYDIFNVAADVVLSETQQATVDSVWIDQCGEYSILCATICFMDGAELTANFLRDDLRAEFDRLVSGQVDARIIYFGWPDDNIVTTDKAALFGKKVTLSKDEFEDCNDFVVKAQSEDDYLRVETGYLLVCDNVFYYADIEQSGIITDFFDAGHYTELTVWEITDADLLKLLKEAKDAYDEDTTLFGDDLSVTFASTGLIILFVLLPLAAAILCFIIFCRAKKPIYKRICLAVSLLAVAELITVILMLVCNFIPG